MEDAQKITNALGRLISNALARAASEQSSPIGDSDRSDEIIKDNLEKAKRLRFARDFIEETLTGAIVAKEIVPMTTWPIADIKTASRG